MVAALSEKFATVRFQVPDEARSATWCGLMRTGELREVLLERQRRARHAGLFDPRAVRAIGCDDTELLVLVDTGVSHGVLS